MAWAYLYRALEELWAVVVAGEEPSRWLRVEYRLACTNAGGAGTSALYVPSALDCYFQDARSVAAHAFVHPATLADGGPSTPGSCTGASRRSLGPLPVMYA